uniref:reverse transcriptase family protein n=1 Tax=Marinobacterium profundum TaxID=1714300 RepID=UPI0009EB4C8E|nr:reverse transcriptase family protein [Marinobacterium profundum]
MNIPPLLFSFTTLDQLISSLDEETRHSKENEIASLFKNKLPPLVSIQVLSTLTGFSIPFIYSMTNKPEKYYRTFIISTGKKKRIIHSPRVSIKIIQKWLAHHISSSVNFNECVYGFVKKKSHILAASKHCGSDWVYSVDIKDFFPSTTIEKVRLGLIDIGYSEKAADLISKISSFESCLAQGSPLSPCLSNIVFKNVDNNLCEIAKNYELTYTRYADDIVFSGTGNKPSQLSSAIKDEIESAGWKLAPGKEFYSDRKDHLKVHGLLVNSNRPKLGKRYRNRIRAYEHLLRNDKISPADKPKIMGHVSYRDSVDTLGKKEDTTPA